MVGGPFPVHRVRQWDRKVYLENNIGALGSLEGPFAVCELRIFAASIVEARAFNLNVHHLHSIRKL